jgi:hypothetical protein
MVEADEDGLDFADIIPSLSPERGGESPLSPWERGWG